MPKSACQPAVHILMVIIMFFICRFFSFIMKLETCIYSGYKIHPGHGKRMVRADGKVISLWIFGSFYFYYVYEIIKFGWRFPIYVSFEKLGRRFPFVAGSMLRFSYLVVECKWRYLFRILPTLYWLRKLWNWHVLFYNHFHDLGANIFE